MGIGVWGFGYVEFEGKFERKFEGFAGSIGLLCLICPCVVRLEVSAGMNVVVLRATVYFQWVKGT